MRDLPKFHIESKTLKRLMKKASLSDASREIREWLKQIRHKHGEGYKDENRFKFGEETINEAYNFLISKGIPKEQAENEISEYMNELNDRESEIMYERQHELGFLHDPNPTMSDEDASFQGRQDAIREMEEEQGSLLRDDDEEKGNI